MQEQRNAVKPRHQSIIIVALPEKKLYMSLHLSRRLLSERIGDLRAPGLLEEQLERNVADHSQTMPDS